MVDNSRLPEETSALIRQFVVILSLSTTAVAFTACGSDDSTDLPTDPSPVAVTETFPGTLTVNGAQTHSFIVERAGTVSAQVKSLSDQTAIMGLSLGTWNGAACQIIISNTAATLNTTVTGTAQSTGMFCVWLNDVGRLGSRIDYSIDVTHF